MQIDGSPRLWFEERRDPCALIVFIDGAARQTDFKFAESKTTVS